MSTLPSGKTLGTSIRTRLDDLDGRVSSLEVISTSNEVYTRPSMFTSAKRSITIPVGLIVAINDVVYKTTSSQTVSISNFGNVAGGNFYVYACTPKSGYVPDFVISQNSTVPTGYTTSNSRKIGGFHTLCADVGTPTYTDSITGEVLNHWLSGYITGDILPLSCWDLWHRPSCDPEGYVYLGYNNQDVWVSIYLLSWNGSKLVSEFGAATADGSSSKIWHGEAFSEALVKQGARLLDRDEFVWAARGCNECTNIKGSADVTTTGGHVDTAEQRMTSNIGCEDTCGFLWQWLRQTTCYGSDWRDQAYTGNVDPRSYGRQYGHLVRVLAGGKWNDGSGCGSRSTDGSGVSSGIDAYCGARGASEPINRHALRVTGYTG